MKEELLLLLSPPKGWYIQAWRWLFSPVCKVYTGGLFLPAYAFQVSFGNATLVTEVGLWPQAYKGGTHGECKAEPEVYVRRGHKCRPFPWGSQPFLHQSRLPFLIFKCSFKPDPSLGPETYSKLTLLSLLLYPPYKQQSSVLYASSMHPPGRCSTRDTLKGHKGQGPRWHYGLGEEQILIRGWQNTSEATALKKSVWGPFLPSYLLFCAWSLCPPSQPYWTTTAPSIFSTWQEPSAEALHSLLQALSWPECFLMEVLFLCLFLEHRQPLHTTYSPFPGTTYRLSPWDSSFHLLHDPWVSAPSLDCSP